MNHQKPRSPIQYWNGYVREAHWLIRITCRAIGMLVALVARLLTVVVLKLARRHQRNRTLR